MRTEIVFTVLSCLIAKVASKIVNTPSGPMRGKAVEFNSETVYQFLRIPYAKPPTGNLRFRKPQPFGSWRHTLDATKHPPACVQEFTPEMETNLLPTDEKSEDCLFLNIFVPRVVSLSNNKAVMIWIHGGGYFAGMASVYDVSDIALTGDVIVVVINYRLGLLGFLSTGDSASPGNYGLWDQRMAIEWVKSNIASFGGNPDSITIFGESAGGMSVAYHALSPYNKGLFQRIIAESGSANAPTLTNNVQAEIIEVVKGISECGEPVDNYALVDCLRHKSADFIINVTYAVVYHFVEKIQFSDICSPVVDGDFLPGLPDDLLNDPTSDSFKMFQSVDVISGVMSGEGSAYIFYIEMMGVNVTEGVSKKMFCDSFAPALSTSFYKGSPEVADAMCKKYGLPDGDTNLEAQGTAVADLLGDLIFNLPCVETVDRHAKGNSQTNTYQFVLSRPLPFYLGSPTPWYDKCAHGTDEVYLFDVKKRFQSSLNMEPTPEDLELSKNMIKYWTKFAKTGDPNGEGLPNWPKYNIDQKPYIDLNLKITQSTKLFGDRMEFIRNDLSKALQRNDDKRREEL